MRLKFCQNKNSMFFLFYFNFNYPGNVSSETTIKHMLTRAPYLKISLQNSLVPAAICIICQFHIFPFVNQVHSV